MKKSDSKNMVINLTKSHTSLFFHQRNWRNRIHIYYELRKTIGYALNWNLQSQILEQSFFSNMDFLLRKFDKMQCVSNSVKQLILAFL